jgi:phospholipase/lecithinase/hemolysin
MAIEALEGRLVLSSFLDNFVKHYTLEGLISQAVDSNKSTPAPGSGATIGVLGDSYSDEYRFYPPDLSTARNWVEILSDTGRANFGTYSVKSRGEPRDQGFAFNWARYGATSSQMVANQLPGLTAQVAKGQVKYVSIFIGGNDFLYFLQGAEASTPAQAPALLAQIVQTEAQAEANVSLAVNTLLAANRKVKLVLTTVPDVSEAPVVKQAEAGNPTASALVSAAEQDLAKYNDYLRAIAASDPSRIALNDLAAEASAIMQVSGGSVPFGGTTINLTTPGHDYHDFFVDGLHVGTVGQGLIANSIVTAIDTQFGAKIKPLTNAQIVQFAAHVKPSTP